MELSKPVMAILYREEDVLKDFLSKLPISRLSESFYFEGLQRYYSKEMGEGLLKVYASLDCMVKKEYIVPFKLWAMAQERFYALEGKRKLNIDAGYVDESHLVLASSKRRGARIYMGSGVYVEIEYLYVYGSYRPLYWTYSDYRDRRVRAFFEQVREDFLKELNLARKGNPFILCRFTEEELYKEAKAW